VIALTTQGRRRLFEIEDIVETEQRTVTARSIDPEIFDLPLLPPRLRAPAVPTPVGPAHVVLLDLPNLATQGTPILTRAAITADPWPGAVGVWASRDGLSFQRVGLVLVPSTAGETLDDLRHSPAACWDRFNRVRVKLYGGTLSSVSDTALFAGANAAAIGGEGGWEIIQFANAELVADDTYELSRLVRGQSGSEWAIADLLPAGASFVLLDENVVSVAQGLDALGRSMQLRVVAAGRDYGDDAAVSRETVPSSVALRPLSPVHPRARRSGDGIELRWIRRTRVDGDSWALQDVPLGEDAEAYVVDILSGGDVVRSLQSQTPSVLYPDADELADFGAPQTTLAVRIAQISGSAGRGFPAETILSVQP
jgi:hypothetical protein